MKGDEVSILALADGATVYPLAPSRDHKRAFDGDRGPNTGGMGAFAPTRLVQGNQLAELSRTLLEPVARELVNRGTPLQGFLYAGLMLTANGPRVLEFNARLGDPETQVVLPLLDGDLAELLMAVASGSLASVDPPRITEGAAVSVVIASGGYPGPIRNGLPIDGLEIVPEDVIVFHAGTRRADDGRVVTSGGRVLNAVGFGDDVATARARAYDGVDAIAFE